MVIRTYVCLPRCCLHHVSNAKIRLRFFPSVHFSACQTTGTFISPSPHTLVSCTGCSLTGHGHGARIRAVHRLHDLQLQDTHDVLRSQGEGLRIINPSVVPLRTSKRETTSPPVYLGSSASLVTLKYRPTNKIRCCCALLRLTVPVESSPSIPSSPLRGRYCRRWEVWSWRPWRHQQRQVHDTSVNLHETLVRIETCSATKAPH